MSSLLGSRRASVVLALVAGLSLSVDVGCGRATLGDPYAFGGNGGAGGAGGATSNTNTSTNTSTSTNATTSTGGSCNCTAFCGALDPCGIGIPNCIATCNGGLDPDLMQCVCEANNCDQIFECAGGSSTMVATSSGTGGGGGFSPQCSDCANQAVETQCGLEINQCGAIPNCVNMFECMGDCGYGPGCEAQCINGPGTAEFYNLIGCAICDACPGPCASSDVFMLCGDVGP